MLLNLHCKYRIKKLCSLNGKHTSFKLYNFIPTKIAVLIFSNLKRTISEIISADAISPQLIITKFWY